MPFFPLKHPFGAVLEFCFIYIDSEQNFHIEGILLLDWLPNSHYTTLKSEIFRDIFRFQIDLDITFVKSHHWDVPVGTQHFEG